MSDDKLELISEDGNSTDGEVVAEPQDTDNSSQVDSEPEKVETLDEVQEKPKPSKDDYAQMAEDTWAKKIANGEATYEELQAKQPWLAARVSNRLGIQEAPKEKFSEIKEYERIKQFDQNKAYIKTLPVREHNEIVKEANKLSKRFKGGLSEALEFVLEQKMPEIEKKQLGKAVRKAGQGLPQGTPSANKTRYTADEWNRLLVASSSDQAQYNNLMDKLENNKITVTK